MIRLFAEFKLSKNVRIFSLLLSLFICSCALLQEHTNTPCSDISGMFRRAEASGSGRSIGVPELTACFKENDIDYQTAINILEEKGFKVSLKSRKEDPDFFVKHKKALNIRDSDEIYISAGKISKFLRLSPDHYGVQIYVQDNKIHRVYGSVKDAYPWP